jgi:hypothetical protein
MPVGVEQWRAAVGVMASSVSAKPRCPIDPRWKKWLKASDPVTYKGCVVMLVVIAELFSSCLHLWKKTNNSKIKEEEHVHVCPRPSRRKTRLLAVRLRPTSETVTMNLLQLLLLLCGQLLLVSCHDTTFDVGPVNCIPVSLERFATSTTSQDPYLVFKIMKDHIKCLFIWLCQMLMYLYCFSLSILRKCLSCSASLLYRKCSKKKVTERVALVMIVSSVRKRLKMVTKIVFVNQMLLMRAGDVERNPGPDTLTMADLTVLTNELHSITKVWYQFGVELKVPVVILNAIECQCKEPASCLTQLLIFWLSNTTPSPTWQTVVGALSCASIQRQDLARHIAETYCHSETGRKHHLSVLTFVQLHK